MLSTTSNPQTTTASPTLKYIWTAQASCLWNMLRLQMWAVVTSNFILHSYGRRRFKRQLNPLCIDSMPPSNKTHHGLRASFSHRLFRPRLRPTGHSILDTQQAYQHRSFCLIKICFWFHHKGRQKNRKRLQIDLHGIRESYAKGDLELIVWILEVNNPSDAWTKIAIRKTSPLQLLMMTNSIDQKPAGCSTTERSGNILTRTSTYAR